MALRELMMPNYGQTIQQGIAAGRQDRTRRTLSEFMQPAIGGDQQALSKIYGADPQAGHDVQKLASEMKAEQRQMLQEGAKMVASMPDSVRPQAYRQFASQARAAGLDYIPEEYSPEFLPGIQKMAGVEAEQPRIVAPGSALVDNTGNLIYERPFAPQKPEYVLSPDGTQWLPKPTGAPQSGGQMIMDDAAASVQDQFREMAPQFGAQISSLTRTPEHNEKVGGVPNSQHVAGTAGDFVVPPEQRARFIAEARRRGFEAIDEDDHIHVELPPGGARGVAPIGAIPIPGARARQGAEETFGQPQVVTDPRTGQQKLVRFGNRGTPQEVSDYAPPPTSRDAKPPTEGERNAAGYLSRMESSERELEASVNAGYDPGNMRDYMTAGQGPLRNWMASDLGQQYRQQQEDWVRAKLRKESGAVIGDDEMEREIKVYFPQPGDGPNVIAKKAQSRKVAIEAMRKSAGRALDDSGSIPRPGNSAPKPGTVLRYNPATGDFD